MINDKDRINNQYNYDYQQNNNNYNNNNYHTEPGVRIITAEEGEKICKTYTENIGPMTAAVATMITAAVNKGLKVDDVLLAIEETGYAPRPSAYYLRAILRNWIKDGVSVHKVKKAVQAPPWYKQNPALNYPQREYRDEDFDGSAYIAEAQRMQAAEKS